MDQIRISVRNLVEFILREGDLDNRISGGKKDAETMQLGARIHRKIQRSMGSGYRSEVTLKYQFPFDCFTVQLEGRADGIFESDEEVVVDEIKGVLRDLELIREPVRVHAAQAKCYAFIYGKEHDLEKVGIQMTYCQMETEEIRRFRYSYTMEELEAFMDELLGQYERWARFQVEWRKVRDASIGPVEFPFTYRKGQKELVTSVYRTILRKKKLFIQAPTGVGKTIAAIFPAVKAVGEGLADKVFYLTARTITRTAAEQAFGQLREEGLQWKTITLTAKEKICFLDEADCNPELCPYAKGHFDRVNDAVYDLLVSKSEFTRDVIGEYARKHQVCPFEMGLDLATWVDGIICDYNYAFDPNAYLRRFFGEGRQEEYLFLVDEAHNLVERGREMYSAALVKEDFLKLKRRAKYYDKKLEKQLEACNRALLELKKECGRYQLLKEIGSLVIRLMNLDSEMERVLETCGDNDFCNEVLELFFAVRRFLSTYDRVDDNYRIYTEFRGDGSFMLKLFCVNPAVNLERFLECGRSAVFFSATFLPIRYYKKLLSTAEDDYAIYVESPFDPANQRILIGRDVSSRYTMRGSDMYRRYAQYIRAAAAVKKGNYMVFFPSYQFLQNVYEAWQSIADMPKWERENEAFDDVDILVQSQYMKEHEREEFLAGFERGRGKSLIGFCVMGGIFSEGIDLTDDRLIGAMIVGTGLPQVCVEREILQSYFDEKGENGFDYAYLYPGANKVLQAAGRVIRTENDRGVVLLLDDRFLTRRYREIFPREWEEFDVVRLSDTAGRLEEFWDCAPVPE